MRFWDTSAVVPLVVDEPWSRELRELAGDDVPGTVWWGTAVETASAIGRREREGSISANDARTALESYGLLAPGWSEVPPTDGIRDAAVRLVRAHDLRAADAFHLAAAVVASDGEPSGLSFVTLDERLALAASREGFPIVPVTAGG